jgi:hypothetical protein
MFSAVLANENERLIAANKKKRRRENIKRA